MSIKTYEGTDYPYAFISYSHKDSEAVMPFLKEMSDFGIRFWYDDRIKHENWKERLTTEIIGSEVMIVFLSENYLASIHCQREVNIADNHNIPFVLLRLDDSSLSGSLEYTFSGLQYKDLFSTTPYTIKELTVNPNIEKCIFGNNKELNRALKAFPVLDFTEGRLPNQIYQKPFSDQEHRNIEWGPDRKLYRKGENPPFPVFNSMISDFYGDERYFTEIKEDGDNGYSREIVLEPDKTYDVRILFHNNADESTNQSGVGICTGLKVAVKFPVVALPGCTTYIESGLQALRDTLSDDPSDIRLPCKKSLIHIWSSAKLYANRVPIYLDFILASGIIENSGKLNGTVLSTNLFTENGIHLGYNVIRGLLPGGEQYAGFIHFKFNTYAPDISKDISLSIEASADGKSWCEKYFRTKNSFILLRVIIRNTGYLPVNDATIKEISSAGNIYKSSKVYSTDFVSGKDIDSFTLLDKGINVRLPCRGGQVTLIQTINTANFMQGEKLNFECMMSFNGCNISNKICIEMN